MIFNLNARREIINTHFFSFALLQFDNSLSFVYLIWTVHHHHHHHHHHLNVHVLPRSIKSMDGCFPTALGRQSTILKAAVYPWESWSAFLVVGCPSSHQPTRIREETLESGGPLQRKLNFRLRTQLSSRKVILRSWWLWSIYSCTEQLYDALGLEPGVTEPQSFKTFWNVLQVISGRKYKFSTAYTCTITIVVIGSAKFQQNSFFYNKFNWLTDQ